MANTYVAIATTTVGSGGAASIEFTSIPGTYTDLLMKYSLKSDTGNLPGGSQKFIVMTLNSNSGSSGKQLQGDGSNATSSSSVNIGGANDPNTTVNTFSNGELYIPNYTSSNAKSVSVDNVVENNATSARNQLYALLYNSPTSAVTSISISPETSGSFAQYSTATLYGIKNTV